MGEYQVISRSALYEEADESSPEETYLPTMEFEEVDVRDTATAPEPAGDNDEDGFAFRLFGGADVMQVSLKDDDEEEVVNERPAGFYRAQYSEDERAQFAAAAVTYEVILLHAQQKDADSHPWKVVSVEEHNAAVERERRRRRGRREGQRKRENKAQCRERRQQRERSAKKAAAHERRQRYGGHGHKQKRPERKAAPARAEKPKPKYRTE